MMRIVTILTNHHEILSEYAVMILMTTMPIMASSALAKVHQAVMTIAWRLYGAGPFHFHSIIASIDKCWLASTFTYCMLRNSCGVIINWIYSSGCTVDGEDN